MNRIITLLFGLFFTTLLLGQNATSKVDYDNDSRWFWGANVGTTWSSADVTKKHDWGWGLTLGKSFNYNYGKPVSFDIRARYLTGKWYGQDFDSTSFAEHPNAALSSGTTDYNAAYGHSVLNFETTIHRAALELVLHANNLRAKTGWDVTVFGGIGYTWYKTYGDAIDDKTGGIYNYDTLNPFNADAIKGILDGNYETQLDGTSGDKFSGAWMPSVGFGIGYQVGPRFSIGLEHKSTFTLADNFDGFINPDGKRKNDIYHYTSAYVRFQIRDHWVADTDEDDNSLGNVDNYNQGQTNVPPIVDFRSPATSGTTVNNPTYVIQADVKNVVSSNNVIFRQNGNYISNFSFNPSTQQFSSTVTLNPGQNIFELTGTNNYGSDQEQTIIIYNREQQNPPIVSYQNPGSSPTTVQNPAYNLVATVLNVTQQSQVAMTLNGQPFYGFSFNASNNGVTATLNLQVGTNIVTTTGTNQYGTDSESTTIIYNPVQTEQPPVVYFVDPNVNPYTTAQGTFNISANVLNVAGAQNITFKQNGSVNQNFTYNSVSDNLQSTVVLNPGQNVFEIIGTNSAGTAQATTIIIYERQAPKPPIVTITNPASNPQETTSPIYNLGATVLNVTQASQITVSLNGQSVSNFNYTASNNGVTATLNLIEGSNVVVVTGTNNDGTDSKQTVIIYRKPVTVQPPVVTYSAPNMDPFTTDQPNYTVVATVLNVASQSGVNVNVNGTNVTNFTFNASNAMVTLPLTLIEGANVITITGTNTAGVDSEPQTIIYRKPAPVQPPVVSFIDPVVNPTTVFNQTYDVKARVRFVQGAQQIVLRINGQVSTNFAYSASSELMTFTTGLVPGANIIEITGTNTAGQDQESTTIIYREPNPTLPPVVTITNPVANPHTVSIATAPIAATVLNVDGSQNIQVLVNGTPISNFTYNTGTKQLAFVMNLISGSNSLVINATNSAGQASDNRTIIYRREVVVVPAPLVTFINPATPATVVNNPGYTVKAHVANVDQASQVVVSQDGQIVSPGLWNFDAVTKNVTFNTNLNAGNNVFTVTGTNVSGSHSATTNIIYTIPVVVCDKPVITFTAPATAGLVVENSSYNVVVTIQFAEASQIKLILNGGIQSPGTLVNGVYTKTVTLVEGQNSIEVVAANPCGETKAVKTITFHAPAAPCNPPVVQRVDPLPNLVVVQAETINIKASVSNVTNVSQLSLVVNGVSVPFNYDAAAHFVSATVNLTVVGENTVSVIATTECGKSRADWKITRQACNAPTVTLSSATVADGTTTFAESFGLTAAVAGVTDQNQITVTHNGQNIGFVYTQQTGVLTLDRALPLGVSKFIITVTNNCGTNTLIHSVTRRTDPNAVPPTIQITTPSTSAPTVPFQTNQAAMTVQIATTHVNAANQVVVTVNGAPTNFNFNAANGSISFNTNFNVGSNVITATAATPYGTATDNQTVIYTVPVTVNPPVITLTNPERCPAAFARGNATITGTVTNISNTNQVVITFGGANINYTSTITGNTLTFSFDVSITATTLNIPLVVTATNEAGTDVKTCGIGISSTIETEGGGQGNGGQFGGDIIRPKNGEKEGGTPTTPTTPVKKPAPAEPTTPVKRP
jgi:large repetitive protein